MTCAPRSGGVTAQLMAQTWQFDAATDAIQLAIDDASDPVTTIAAIDGAMLGPDPRRAARRGPATWRPAGPTTSSPASPAPPRKNSPAGAACCSCALHRSSSATTAPAKPATPPSSPAPPPSPPGGLTYPMPHNPGCSAPPPSPSSSAENAIIENRPDHTLAIARQIEEPRPPAPQVPPPPPPRRRQRPRRPRQHAEAAEVLAEVHRGGTPEWLAQQRYARDIVTRMIGHRRTSPPRCASWHRSSGLPY